MINEKMYGLGDEPSAIRELFAYGMARKAEIGAENVFDFSIGNPSVPAPELVRETMLELLRPYGLREVIRTGTIATQKGSDSITVKNNN